MVRKSTGTDASTAYEVESKEFSLDMAPDYENSKTSFKGEESYNEEFFANLPQQQDGNNNNGSSTNFKDMGNYQSMSHMDYSKQHLQSQSSRKALMLQAGVLPFVGRQHELELLQRALDRISLEWMENPGEVAWVRGVSGVGKSTLIKHVTNNAKKAFVCRGSCEEHFTASKPFRALTDCLNDVCLQLLNESAGARTVWKQRLEEALGGEGPLLATICPQLASLLKLPPPLSHKELLAFDANLPHRFERLAFAVRDFLQAVSEHHPLVMVVDNIQWADLDSLQMMQDLLTTKPLQNFLLVGCFEPVSKSHAIMNMQAAIADTDTKITQISLQALDLTDIQTFLQKIFVEGKSAPQALLDDCQDLAEILFALSKGNPLWIVSLLRLLEDEKLLQVSAQGRWEWNRKKIKKQIKDWKDSKNKAFGSVEGVVATRIEKLPTKLRFLIETLSGLMLTFFSVDKLHPILAAAYSKEKKNDKGCPIASQEELEGLILKACNFGMLRKVSKKGYYKFSHDVVRVAASRLLPRRKDETISWVHIRMGAHLSSMCMESKGEDRERFKFMAVAQLNKSVKYLPQAQKAKLAKLNLEAAEIAITKSAFRTAVAYLEAGVAVISSSMQWEKQYYEVTLRNYLFLARMNYCVGRFQSAKAACAQIFKHGATLKDKVYANQVLMLVLMEEGDYETALKEIIRYLGLLGEEFPSGDQVNAIIKREITNVRGAVNKKPNQELLNPTRMTDKKSVDVMWLLSTLVEISEHCQAKHYKDMATIRMMHISLRYGFSRQYPLAFALFSVMLVKKGLIKEAHRCGQVAEKVARLTDFYGGQAVALFHRHVGHWRRTYKRSLEPVLSIYNAQVDAGDFHHVDFSIATYIQYHLASGFDLERLSDNLMLFDGLYDDYDLPNDWYIIVPFQVTANLLAENQNPLVFFGDTIDQQELKLKEMKEDGLLEAVEYVHFMRCYIAFFFHDIEVMQESLDALTMESEGVWIPWRVFFECYILIQHLAGSKGKKRKEIKDGIEEKKNKLVDWFNAGAPNPSAMISILEAEYVIAKEAGKGAALSSMKVQGLFKEAVDAAVADGAVHLEAFACERAGMHFHSTGVDGSSSDYLIEAHKLYDKWHAVAKVIDIESKYSGKLRIVKKRQRAAHTYIATNRQMRRSTKEIGGGAKEVKSMSIKNAFKGAKKLGKKAKGLRAKKIKNIFGKKEKAAAAPWGFNSNSQMDAVESVEMDAGQSPKSPGKKKNGLLGVFSPTRSKKTAPAREAEETENTEQSPRTSTPGTSPKTGTSPRSAKSTPKPRRGTKKSEPDFAPPFAEDNDKEETKPQAKASKPRRGRPSKTD